MYTWYHLHPITQFQTCQKCSQMCLLPGQQPALTLQLEILHIIEHLQKKLFEVTDLSYWTKNTTFSMAQLEVLSMVTLPTLT